MLHPDAIREPAAWDALGDRLCLENMDKRKDDGRTDGDMQRWFDRFPAARFCLDLAHARQVDPSMTPATRVLRRFGDRIAQVHVSELNARGHHEPLSYGSILAFHGLRRRLPRVAVILESCVEPDQVATELEMARAARPHDAGHDGLMSLPWGDRRPILGVAQCFPYSRGVPVRWA